MSFNQKDGETVAIVIGAAAIIYLILPFLKTPKVQQSSVLQEESKPSLATISDIAPTQIDRMTTYNPIVAQTTPPPATTAPASTPTDTKCSYKCGEIET